MWLFFMSMHCGMWIAYVLKKNEEKGEVCVSFLHTKEPSNLFHFPEKSDVLYLPKNNVLTKVNPITAIRRFYAFKTVIGMRDYRC